MINCTIKKNAEHNSTEIVFSEKPAEAVREALKAARFRWHAARRVWYGYKTPEETRELIEKAAGGPSASSAAKKAPAKKAGTPQKYVAIYWNGIKINGGKLIKCGYYLGNGGGADYVTIYGRDYSDLPRDLLPVKNESDVYTDYFENDRATIDAGHPLFKYFRYAAIKADAHHAKQHADKYLKKQLARPVEPFPGAFEYYKKELDAAENRISALEAEADPGQPTAEDLELIDRARQEAENARRAAELKEEQERAERAAVRRSRRGMIEEEQAAHPIEEGAPSVLIRWSEHPAFYSWPDDTLRLSVKAAEDVLRALDDEETEKKDGYFKTRFCITGTDPETGEPINYEGRYDLGDGDGGLLAHIRAAGAIYGGAPAAPERQAAYNDFADFLARFCA